MKAYRKEMAKKAVILFYELLIGITVSAEGVIATVLMEYGDVRRTNLLDDWTCRYLENQYMKKYNESLPTAISKQALRQIQAKAESEIRAAASYPRVYHKDGKCYLNMCNRADEIIVVSAETVSRVPYASLSLDVQFRTDAGEIKDFELPGNPKALFELIRIPKELQLVILVTLIASLIGDIEKPIISLIGEAGSAKTTTARIIKGILDPSKTTEVFKAKTSAMPNKRDDFALILSQQYVTIMDNVTSITEGFSDLICQQSTGGNDERRKLYTNTETVSLPLGGLLILTSIEDVIKKDDAVDRTIKVYMEPVNNGARLGNSEVAEHFDRLRGSILGGMFSTLRKALEIYPSIKDRKLELPRLADFGRYGYAIAEALGDGLGGQFLGDYNMLREAQKRDNLNNDGFFTLLNYLLREHPYYWSGNKGTLVSELHDINTGKNLNYPKSCIPAANKLDKKLESMKYKLANYGVHYNTSKNDGYAIIELLKVPTQYLILKAICCKQKNMNLGKNSAGFDTTRVPILITADAAHDFNEYFIREYVAAVFDKKVSGYRVKKEILRSVINDMGDIA